MQRIPYAHRIPFCKHALATQLLTIIENKKTNLSVSADLMRCSALLKLADAVGPYICVLKLHIDMLEDFEIDFTRKLVELSIQHQFLIFEDRKFADIGETVRKQYGNGIYRIADWAHIVNAHTLPGVGVIQGLEKVGLQKERALLLVAEMSAPQNLMDEAYTQKTVDLAAKFPEFVMGFVSQRKLSTSPQWLHFTPGIQIDKKSDALGQGYISPEKAIKNGADIIMVGRGIYEADDPIAEAKKYRELGWQAHTFLCN